MSKRNCHGIKKQSSEKVTATKVKGSHLPFSWPSKPGTPRARTGIFLVMSCLHQSAENRMSFEKKKKTMLSAFKQIIERDHIYKCAWTKL